MTAVALPVPAIDDADLGPCMRALKPKYRAFVIAKVFHALNNTQAARAAGLGHSVASDVWHREDVQAAVGEMGRKLMRGEGPRSIHTLVAIRDDPAADNRDRIKCAIELLNRSGFHAVSEGHLTVEHKLSETEMDRRILALCAELGLSEAEARKMLVAPAEFEKNAEGVYEIPAEPKPEPPPPSKNALALRRSRARRRGKTPEELGADRLRRLAAHAERLRRERREADARRAAIVVDGEEY